MGIPDFQSIMLPLLKFIRDKEEHSLHEAIEFLADEFSLTDEERKELLPSGQQAIFNNRVGWARTYTKKAGLIETTRRGYFKITENGLNVLRENPSKININYLKRFPNFIKFQTIKGTKTKKVAELKDIVDFKFIYVQKA